MRVFAKENNKRTDTEHHKRTCCGKFVGVPKRSFIKHGNKLERYHLIQDIKREPGQSERSKPESLIKAEGGVYGVGSENNQYDRPQYE